jgi:hypothetical protein
MYCEFESPDVPRISEIKTWSHSRSSFRIAGPCARAREEPTHFRIRVKCLQIFRARMFYEHRTRAEELPFVCSGSGGVLFLPRAYESACRFPYP